MVLRPVTRVDDCIRVIDVEASGSEIEEQKPEDNVFHEYWSDKGLMRVKTADVPATSIHDSASAIRG